MLLENARIIDGTGHPPYQGSLLIREGRIAFIGDVAALTLPPDTPRLDAMGRTLLPGLIDTHVHILYDPDPSRSIPLRNIPLRDWDYVNSRRTIFAIEALRKTLEAGFTTIRDLSAPNAPIFALRDALLAGEISGPRLLASGMCITHTGGHGTEALDGSAHVADGVEAVVTAVRHQVTVGADVIKIMGGTRPAFSPPFRGRAGYTAEEMRAAVEEAHRAQIRTAVHAHSSLEGIRNCIAAGVDSIEHGFGLDIAAAEAMAERGLFLTPTLSVPPAGLEAAALGLWTYPGAEDQLKRTLDLSQRAIQAAITAGVRISLGSDASLPLVWHGGNARELELMVEYGMTAMQALVAATHDAADNLGLLSEIGTLEVGKQADMIVVDGDPLHDIRVLRDLDRITHVIQAGVIVINRHTTPVSETGQV